MLTRAWRRLNDETVGTPMYFHIGLQNQDFWRDIEPLARRHLGGRILDLGAGRLAFKSLLQGLGSAYVSADLTAAHPELDLCFDLGRPFPLADMSFDSVFCCSVLEHAREPWRALGEIRRVLKPGGIALVSVPFLFYLHGEPHDYWRFTGYGARALADEAGLETVAMVANGSLLHLVLNAPSVALSTLLAGIGLQALLRPVTGAFVALARGLGPRLDREGRFAQSHLLVLRRPGLTPSRREP